MRTVMVSLVVFELLELTGCSRSPRTADGSLNAISNAEQAQRQAFRRYDPTSLIEVKSFSELPEDLKAAIRAGKVPEGRQIAENDPGGYRIFTAGGVSKTSALIGYEYGDYVPQEGAVVYVLVGSNWILAKKWDTGVAHVATLSQLEFITDYLSKNPSEQK